MQDAKGNGRLAQAKPIIAESTAYSLVLDGESEADTSSGNGKAMELVRLYDEGNRDFAMADLHRADLQGVNLQNARLFMANLRKANLRGANLQGAKLRGADLYEADLREADLRGANLQEVNLIGAKLAGAKLDNVTQISVTWRLICETVTHDNNRNNGHKSNSRAARRLEAGFK